MGGFGGTAEVLPRPCGQGLLTREPCYEPRCLVALKSQKVSVIVTQLLSWEMCSKLTWTARQGTDSWRLSMLLILHVLVVLLVVLLVADYLAGVRVCSVFLSFLKNIPLLLRSRNSVTACRAVC
jgi:hypothetical protein